MRITRSLLVVTGVVAVVLLASVAQGALINYGDFVGDHFIYRQVSEDSSTDPVPLYGAPQVADDAITFAPVSFGAFASGAGGFDFTDGTLQFSVDAIGSAGIEAIRFQERGDYSLGGGIGSTSTAATITASLLVRIVEINHVGVTPIPNSLTLTFTPSGGTYDIVNDRGVGILWSGSGEIDVARILGDLGVTGRATKVDVSIDNILLATSESGTFAYIKKKQMEGLTVQTVNVPEPVTVVLFVIGGLALAARPLRRWVR